MQGFFLHIDVLVIKRNDIVADIIFSTFSFMFKEVVVFF